MSTVGPVRPLVMHVVPVRGSRYTYRGTTAAPAAPPTNGSGPVPKWQMPMACMFYVRYGFSSTGDFVRVRASVLAPRACWPAVCAHVYGVHVRVCAAPRADCGTPAATRDPRAWCIWMFMSAHGHVKNAQRGAGGPDLRSLY